MLPASVPIRLSGETDTDQLAEEQDRAAQNEQMEGIVDERVRAVITRPLRSIEDDNDVEVQETAAWRATGYDSGGSGWSVDKRHDDRRPCSDSFMKIGNVRD